jgi:hypothetical protein
MVQLHEVVDEHFEQAQPGPEDDDYSDTGTCVCVSHSPAVRSEARE